ncbi:zinc finger protein 37 homolog [Aedes aegypti]|uniref:C2H2-type domain-containing protein n=1 Tax=Aedes aegypti TaxID=7159 RepID=A0A6I8TD55_AEDAE|nr:zinc finger protein 37 homolog [Aedes aegypti]
MSSIALPNVESDSFNHENEGSSKRTIPGECDRQLQNERENSENLGRDPVPIEANENSDAKCGSAEQTNIGDGTTTKNASSGRKRGRPPKKPDKPPPQEQKKKGRPKNEANCNLSCDICGKDSNTLRDLELHQKIHFGIKDFECEYCHVRFAQKGTLKVHLRTHTGEKPFKCSYCPEAFAQKVSLDNHVFKHTGKGVKCPLCPSIHATPSSVKQHMKQVHSEERPNVCQICGRSYKKKRDLMKHIEGHDNRICSVCGKVFDTMYALKTHMHIHAGNRCSFCNRSFKSEEELQAHAKLRGRAHQCELCCYSFNKAEFLSNHHRRNHWKVMGLEQLVWNFPPRPKKPKPPKKAKAPRFSVGLVDENLVDFVVSNSVPLEQAVTKKPTVKPESSANVKKESIPAKAELPKTESLKHQDQQSDDDCDFPGDVAPLDDDSDSELKYPGNLEENVIEKPTESEDDVKIDVKVEDEPSLPLPVEVFVKLEEGDGETLNLGGSQLENELSELDVKKESSSDSEDDDVPLAALKLKTRLEKKLHPNNEDDQIIKPTNDSHKFKSKDHLASRSIKKVHDEVTNLECKFCHKQFSGKRVLREHVRTHTGDKPYKCQHCSKSFRFNCLLNKHLLKHTKQGIKCDLCPRVFATKTILKQHKENIHAMEKNYKCQLCEKRFKFSRSLRIHLHRHEDKTCKRCGEVCNGLAALIEHRKTAHPPVKEKPGPLICELCGKTSASASSLAAHRAQHKEYLRFKCDECPKAFVFKGMLETHKRVEHHGERHICPNCGKQFKHLAYLKRHSYQHKEDKGFKCEKCPSAFRHPGALRYHVRAKHGETMFPCSLCSKEYRTAEALKVHQKIHSDERRFHCEFCPREFIQRATLLKHMTIHSADRQQKCVVCEQIFYKKVELAIHQAKEHPNHPLIGRTVKLHTCGICGMNFTKENLLRQHTDIHGSEYKFKCDMCEDKKFKQMAGLRYHWHHFHGIEPPKRNLGKKTEKKAEKVDQGESRSAPFENDLEFMIYSTACGSTSSNTR